ncbi:MAG: ACP S-malonyltransferase [Firmicutes bacterium]|nr:ACP S-malonyltransferase [Bacillota bacterium]
MGKVAFLFPGQGAQYVGMGKDIYDKYPKAAEVFDKANESLGMDIKKMCFEGPEEQLVKTENTQPAILTTSIAFLRVIEEELGLKADVTAGLSLGEYCSLVYSGALSFEDAVKLVKKRGKYMQEAVPVGKGTMAAIIGLKRDEVEEAIAGASSAGIVEGANYNCPGQIVISGEVPAVEKACELAKEKGAKRALILPVSAPFHCQMLKPAGVKLNEELENVTLSPMNKQVISNVTASYIGNESEIQGLLTDQVSKSVLWEDTIELMLKDGVETFIEIGPGKSITGFIKKTIRKHKEYKKVVSTYNVEDLDSLNKLIEEFK